MSQCSRIKQSIVKLVILSCVMKSTEISEMLSFIFYVWIITAYIKKM